ncbi:MAG: hypothetical protein ACI364_00420 [Coriobacteriales bacterium]|jgi:hypothetical protein
MLEHTLEHKVELEQCRDALAAKGRDDAADALSEGIAYMNSACACMQQALEKI